MAKDVTDEVLKLSSLEDNKENRDCQFINRYVIFTFLKCYIIKMKKLNY